MQSEESKTRKMLLDIHLAEYQVQSNRITYWITLQYATYTIAALGLGFLIQVWSSIQPLTLALTATLLGQVFVLAMLHVDQEMFTNVLYIEKRLKPRVGHLVGQHGLYEFWEFEPLLAQGRKTGFVARFETRYMPLAIFVLVIVIGVAFIGWGSAHASNSWKKSHFFWLFCNTCVFLLVAAKLPGFLKLQNAVLGGDHPFSLQERDEAQTVTEEEKAASSTR